MKKLCFIAFLLTPFSLWAQGPTMKELAVEYPDAFVLMFYHSSLNMLNIEDNEDFARVIHDIDKIKLLRIDKGEADFTTENLSSVRQKLRRRSYEELMTIKSKDSDVAVFIQEDDEDIEGFFLYMDEADTFTAIDVRGYIQIVDIGLLVDKLKEVDKL
jgi:hypothetical protein